MKIELHAHTSRLSLCSIIPPEELLHLCIQAGYGCVFITEHDAVWSDEDIASLQATFPQILVFPGVELSVGEEGAGHLLVLGTTDEGYLSIKNPQEVLKKARSENHLTILAHPFRWEHAADMLEGNLLPDAVEHLTGNQEAAQAEMTKTCAARLNLPIVNSGDVHGDMMINHFWIQTDRRVQSVEDVRRLVIERAYTNYIAQ